MYNTAKDLGFTVPLSFEAHAIAQQLGKQQTTPEKAKQVYLNTLAVYAVDFYLRCMGFGTDWAASDSRNPTRVRSRDVADLWVHQVGRLECRPVLPDAEVCTMPAEVWSDRIAYVAVQFNSALNQATLLGFAQTAAQTIPLSQLQPLDQFLAYCHQQQRTKIRNPSPLDLRDWFAGTITAGWQTLADLSLAGLSTLESAVPLVAYRNDTIGITRGQEIDLGLEVEGQSVALVVTLPPQPASEMNLRVQLYPMAGQSCLPSGIQLSILDQSGEMAIATESREADNLIQLEFSVELGEFFSVVVALGEATVRQDFTL